MTRQLKPHDPARFRDLTGDVRYAPLWLAPRIVLGWFSLQAGWRLLQGLPWPGGQVAGGASNEIMAIGLTLAGIALILGAMTGPAAFAAGCLSAGLWAGEGVATAAAHFALVVLMILAWKSAGWIGLDRWLLPLLGLQGQGGALVGRKAAEPWLETTETNERSGRAGRLVR